MRGKRGLGGLACALAAMLLTACYAGVEHMLEEDYNPRFVMEEPLPQVQEPAPPEQPAQPQTLDFLRSRFGGVITANIQFPSYIEGEKYEWAAMKRDGSWINPNLFLQKGQAFNIYGPSCGLKVSDSPLIVSCTLTLEDGSVHHDSTVVFLFGSSEELHKNWNWVMEED